MQQNSKSRNSNKKRIIMSNKNLIGSSNKLLLYYTEKRERGTLFLRICEGTNEKPIFTISKIVFWHVANTLLSFRYDILYFSFASLLRSQYFARVFFRYSRRPLSILERLPCSIFVAARFIDFRVYVRDAPRTVNPRVS